MKTHTPAPWYVSGSIQPQIVSENDPTGRTLALVYEIRDETTANAQLIAAAPELLNAAKQALEDVTAIQNKYFPGAGWGKASRMVSQLRAAISKAEGARE